MIDIKNLFTSKVENKHLTNFIENYLNCRKFLLKDLDKTELEGLAKEFCKKQFTSELNEAVSDYERDKLLQDNLEHREKLGLKYKEAIKQDGITTGEIEKLTEVYNKDLSRIQKPFNRDEHFNYSLEQWQRDLQKIGTWDLPYELYNPSDRRFKKTSLEIPRGEITLLSGKTFHGKTTIAINFLLDFLLNDDYKDKRFYFFSYEVNLNSIVATIATSLVFKKYLKNYNSMDGDNYKSLIINYVKGNLPKNKLDMLDQELVLAINKAVKQIFNWIKEKRLNIKYTDYSIEAFEKLIKSVSLEDGDKMGVIFIDYIQLVGMAKRGNLTRTEELKNVCTIIKDLKNEFGTTFIMSCQFNRIVPSHEHLEVENISESTDIEKVASLIIAFWNNTAKPFLNNPQLIQLAKSNEKNYFWDKCLSDFPPQDTLYLKIIKNRDLGAVGGNNLLNWDGNKRIII